MLVISSLKEEDIPAAAEIENLSFNLPRNKLIFSNGQFEYLVAKEDGKVVGFIGYEKNPGLIFIVHIAVHPGHRRKGIGKKLLERILNNHAFFALEVRASNAAAQKLYEKYGFKKIGIRPNYYPNNSEDGYFMIKMRGEAEANP